MGSGENYAGLVDWQNNNNNNNNNPKFQDQHI